ncbi:hypothetical protein AGMMS50256_23500 [Betaproteobacteria bacterium]|nr:hypothetical protein AGMMS50256_23500 [Betaproteobacteria bacterium]
MNTTSSQGIFTQLIAALTRQTGIDLPIDENDSCTLAFDDIPVTLQYFRTDGRILFYGVIGEIPPDPATRQALYTRLLEANFLFHKTGGATLAVNEAAGLVTFQQAELALALSETDFLNLLESWVQLASYWRGVCLTDTSAPPGPDSNAENQTASAWMRV